MKRRSICSIIANRDGAALVEFALVAPVLLGLLMGVFDIGYNMYANTMLHGAIHKAARDSSLEGATPTTINNDVKSAVQAVVPQAQFVFSRKAYASFSDVLRPEDFTDLDGDGLCNNGEPFEDANGNGTYDTDRGTLGSGGARDAVLYEVTISYPRVFPVAGLLGLDPNHATTATTVLRNQPFSVSPNHSATSNCA